MLQSASQIVDLLNDEVLTTYRHPGAAGPASIIEPLQRRSGNRSNTGDAVRVAARVRLSVSSRRNVR
jgi:hypothetical protein